MRAGERERPGAEFRHEYACEVPRRVSEAGGETRHAVAFYDAVGDEAHRAGGEVVAQVPIGRAWHGIRLASLAGTQPGFVCGRGCSVEGHVLFVCSHGGAAGATVDPSGVNPRDELTVEARVTG